MNALHLIQAVELLNEVAAGNAEPCIRKPLVQAANALAADPRLAGVASYMHQFAEGWAGHEQATAHIDTIKTFAGAIVVVA